MSTNVILDYLSRVNPRLIAVILGNVAVFVFTLYMFCRPYPHIFFNFNNSMIPNIPYHSSNMTADENPFITIGKMYQTDKVTSHHYGQLYEKYLRRYVGTNVYILEIGLGCGMYYGPGASAYLWRNYLGPRANIHFIEFDRRCGEEWYKNHGQKLNITMHYGSQDDVGFLQSIISQQDKFDIIVDDGGHTMIQQITSFTQLLSKVRPGGIYVIEDLLTSYLPNHGGGFHVNGSTIELIKTLADDIQVACPQKTTKLFERIYSFEISNEICFFNVK